MLGGIDASTLRRFKSDLLFDLDVTVMEEFRREQLPAELLETVGSEAGRSVLLLLSHLMSSDPERFVLKIHDRWDDATPPGPETPYYRYRRYDIQRANRCGSFRNSDELVNFQIENGNVHVDTYLDKLPRTDSDGSTYWESYNWVLIREKGRRSDEEGEGVPTATGTGTRGKFHLIFARHDEGQSAELGLKHTMLALPNDLWAAGEMRIVKTGETWLFQFNLNSSLNSTPSIGEMVIINRYRVPAFLYRKLLAHKLRRIMERLVTSDPLSIDHAVQFVEEEVVFREDAARDLPPAVIHNGRLITNGIHPHGGSIDPVHGLLHHYYRPTCPPLEYARRVHAFCADRGLACHLSLSTGPPNVLSLEQVVERLRASGPGDAPALLGMINRFISSYYGLYFLDELIRVVNSPRRIHRATVDLLLHGGFRTVLMFNPVILHHVLNSVLLSTRDLSERLFAAGALCTEDSDYIVPETQDQEDVRDLIMTTVKFLNEESAMHDKVVALRRHFTNYYFQKNCPQKVHYSFTSVNEELFRMWCKCGSEKKSLLDVFRNARRARFTDLHDVNVFIVDLIIIFEELLIGDPKEGHGKAKTDKRLFRSNLFFSMIKYGHLNHFQVRFDRYVYREDLTTRLVNHWNGHASRFYSGRSWLTVDAAGGLIWSDSPVVLTGDLFRNIVNLFPGFEPYVPPISLTDRQETETRRLVSGLPQGEVHAGIPISQILNIIREYTSHHYQKMNSCLYNYLYTERCNPKLLNQCHGLHRFIRRFSDDHNTAIYGSLRELKVFRTENNVSLGLIGGYYQCKVGDRFVSPSFWSTSYGGVVNVDQKEILLEIALHPDDRFMIISSLSYSESEKEILIPFGTIFQVREKGLVEHLGRQYLLIKLDCVDSLNFEDMPEFYATYHRFNYSKLPNDHLVPIKDWSKPVTCDWLGRLKSERFLKTYDAPYSNTLPLVIRFGKGAKGGKEEFVLKLYLYRRSINGVVFPNRIFKHPLDVELEVLRRTQTMLDHGFVTPNLLGHHPGDNGHCTLQQVKSLIRDKNLCRGLDPDGGDPSWVCRSELRHSEYLDSVPYRLLEKADGTVEDLGIDEMYGYVFQVFYTMRVLHRRHGLVHFDLKPGNIFVSLNRDRKAQTYRVGGEYFRFKSPHIYKIGDYDASFLGDWDNIFISRDAYHRDNIRPLTFALPDRDKLDVKLFFDLHDDKASKLDGRMGRVYQELKMMAEGETVEGFTEKLCRRLKATNFCITQGFHERLKGFRKSERLYGDGFSEAQGCHLPMVSHPKYPVLAGPSFVQFRTPEILTNQARNFPDKLRVMTYNVHEWGKGETDMWRLIIDVGPDVLAVQEGTDTMHVASTHVTDSMEEVLRHSDYSLVRCKADVHLYNYVYLRSSVTNHRILFSGRVGMDDRCAIILLCEMRRHGYRFLLVATHLSNDPRSQISNVEATFQRLDAAIRDHALEGVDIFFVGDFNSYSKPGDPAELQQLLRDKSDYYERTHGSSGPAETSGLLFGAMERVERERHDLVDTYDLYVMQHALPIVKPAHTTIYKGKVDHIYASKRLSRPVLGCYQIMDNRSDHTPLVVDVSLKCEPPTDGYYRWLGDSLRDMREGKGKPLPRETVAHLQYVGFMTGRDVGGGGEIDGFVAEWRRYRESRRAVEPAPESDPEL